MRTFCERISRKDAKDAKGRGKGFVDGFTRFFLGVLFMFALASAPSVFADDALSPAEMPSARGVAIRQAMSAVVEQRGILQEPRDEKLGQSDWWLELQADATWRVDLGDRFSLSVSPRIDWKENGGMVDGFDFSELDGQKGEGEASLRRAEASFSLSEWGLELLAGKLRPQFGVNYIEPLSLMNLGGRDSYDDGLWLSGFLLSSGAFSLEAYGQPQSDPVLYGALSALFDIHELGLLYKREGPSSMGDFFGAWYRTQIGEGLIPYGEIAARSDSGFLDLDGQVPRDLGWNWEALVGLGWSPSGVNLSAYLEYRYRQAGYDENDWDRVGALSLPAVGAYLGDFPYLQTARHAVGLHLQSQDEVLGFLTWSATCIYLLPDGLFAQARLEARFIERCRIGLAAELASSIDRDSDPARSEPGLWPYERRVTLYLNWKINAKEDAYDAL
jgi:hypothetical protein